MSLGLESGVVRVVPYDDSWPRLFAEERARILDIAGDVELAIEHTGSTSVPGLAAKPILDLLGGYPSGADLRQYIRALTRAGYVHRGEQGIPGREFFRRGDPRAYHFHLTTIDGRFWQDHLAFRDALRGDPGLRDQYAALKLELAKRYPNDRESYIDAKTEFIRRVLARSAL